MSRLLLATDGSAPAEAALDFALAMFGARSHDWMVVAVAAPPLPGMAPVEPDWVEITPLERAAVDRQLAAERALARAIARIRAAGGTVRGYCRFGPPTTVLLEMLRGLSPDALILGNPPRDTLARRAFGSTADRLLHAWPGVVLLVPEGGRVVTPRPRAMFT
ncbi:MAG: universal stress protein [Candidatus Sericytochromatia bacterium]|nr:universal stress protein [Candidatus Sericytochromatia bacterium]